MGFLDKINYSMIAVIKGAQIFLGLCVRKMGYR